MNNKYLEQLYGWIESKDSSFSGRYKLEDFINNMDDEEYAVKMYEWISKKDPTFQERYTLDLFIEKVKKKDLSPDDPISESMEDAGLGEDSEEEGTVSPSTPSASQPSEGQSIEFDEESFSINQGQVDKETFQEYDKLQQEEQKRITDPFENAVNNITPELLAQDEEELVPDLAYRFGRYGFKFDQAEIFRDFVKITSDQIDPTTGKPYELKVKVDNKDEEKNLKAAQDIKDFIRKYQKVDTRFEKTENDLATKDRLLQSDKEVQDQFRILNIESQAFNNRVQEYIKKRRIYLQRKAQADSLTQEQINTDVGQAFLKDLEQARVMLEKEKADLYAEDAALTNRGYEIDMLVGKYSEMKAKKGTFLGATWNSITTGVSRISETLIDYSIDTMVEAMPFNMMLGQPQYEKSFAKRAEELGYFNPDDIDEPFESFEAFKQSFTPEQINEINNYIEDRVKKSSKYGNIEFNDDGSITTKQVDAGTRYSDQYLKDNIGKLTEDGMMSLVREGYMTLVGNEATTVEYSDMMREGFWGGAWLGLAESLPAFIGPGGWIGRTSRMFAQVDSHLRDEMMTDPDFADISESERKAVSLPIAITVGALEYFGFRNVMNQKGLLNKYVLKGLQKYKGAHQTQGLSFRQVVLNEIENDVAKGVLIVGAGGLAEFETGVAQEIADISGKLIYNEIKGKDMFQTPESVRDAIGQIMYAGAQEAVGGWVMSTVPAVAAGYVGKDYTAISDPMFETFEDISNDGTFYKAYVQKIKNDINKGSIDKAEGKSLLEAVQDIRSIVPKVPQDLDTESRKKAVGLLYNKAILQRQREAIAPELRGKIDKEIGKIDTQLKNLIEGAAAVKGTEANIEQDEDITDAQAKQYIENENKTRAKLGLPAIQLSPKSIEEAKVELKKQRDASKEQSPVQETGEVESQATEEVVEGVPDPVSESAGTSNQKGKGKVTPKKETQVEEEVGDIQEFVGETEGDVVSPTTELGVQEEVEFETENVTKDGKVKRSKSTTPIDTEVESKFEGVVKFATRAAKAVKRILPKVNIVLHESSENFQKATGKTGRGFYNPTDQTIHVDLTKGNNRTVAHEMFHALLLDSVKTNAEARELTKRMVKAVAKAKGLTKQQKQKIDNFIKNYDTDIQNEEKLAEIMGVLADGYTKLDAPTKSRVRQWVEKIASKLGINIASFTQSDQDIVDLMNTVSQKIRTGETITQKDVKALKPKRKTQKQQVKDVLGEVEVATIKQITEITGLPEPTVRRILGQGAKNGELSRVAAGVYTLKTKDGKTAAVVQGANALTEIKKLVKEGAKFDMIFLDPPYIIPGARGGNRNLTKYKLISPEQFNEFVGDVVKLLQNPDTPVFFMFSASKSNKKQLAKYYDAFTNNGLKPSSVAAQFGKLDKQGKPKQMFGIPLKEWIFAFSQSGNQRTDMDFSFDREYAFGQDSNYQTAKPVALLEAIIKASTKAGELILDPFAGSGSTAKAAVKTGRSVVTIEENVEQAENIKKEVKQEQQKKKQKGDQLDIFEGREQKEAKPIAERYMMSPRGFINPRALYDTSRLRRELENIGMRLGTAKNEFTGEITGYYFQKVSKSGKPYFYNPFGRQQKDIDKAGSGISNIAELIVKLREANFSPEAIKTYLLEKKKIATNVVNKLTDASTFVLSRMPESFQKLQGGFLTGVRLFEKISKYKDRLTNTNLTSYGKAIVRLQQELEVLQSQKNKKRAIAAKQKQIDDLKAKNPGAKIYKLTNTEIMTKTIEFMRKQPEYIAVKDKKGLSLLQAQMEMQLEKSFYQAPTKDMANQIRLARAVVNMQTKNVKSLDRVKSSLRNFLRVVLPAEMYTKKETIDIVREIQNATLDNINEVKAKVMDMATVKIVNGLETKIKKLLNRDFAKVEGGRLKAKLVDSQTIKLLEQVKNIFSNVRNIKDNPKKIEALVQKNLDRISKLQSESIQNENTFAEIAALEMINDYANAQLEEDSSFEKVAGLNRVFEQLNETVNEGRNTLEAQKRRRYHTYLRDIEIAWESITGNKIEMLVPNTNYDPQLPETKSNLKMVVNPDAKNIMKEFQNLTDAKKRQAKSLPARMVNSITGWIRRNQIANIMDLTTLVEYITKTPGRIFGGPFQDITARLVDDASIVHKAFQMEDRAEIENKLEEIYGKGWIGKMENDSLLRDTGIATDLEKYNKAKAEYERNKTPENKIKMESLQLHLSPYQMAYHLNQYRDPANHASYEAKYGKDYKRVMKEMREYMEANNSEALVLADYMVEEAYPRLYDRYNQTYRAVYGMDLPWSKDYGGQIFREGVEPGEINLLADGGGAFAGMAAPSSSKVRSKNKIPIRDMDLMRSFIAYQEQMNWFAAYAPSLNRINKLFRNPNISEAIESQYPDGFYNMILNQIDTLASKGISNTRSEQWLNIATTYFVVGRLGVNPTIFLKQLVSFPTYANDIGYRNWSKNATLSIGDIRRLTKEVMNNSVYLQDRYGKAIIKNLENFVPSSDYESKLTTGAFQKILDATMWLVKQGDKGAILIGGIPLYRYHKNKIRKENPGFTEQQVIDRAIREFEIATRQTQQSTDLQNRDYTQTRGIFQRTMNMFKTSIRSYLRKEIIYGRNMYKIIRSFGKEGRGTFGQNLRGLFTYHVVLPVFFQYLSAGLPGVLAPWDDEDATDLKRAALIGNLNALFVMGDILAMFADSITGKPWEADVTDIPFIEQMELLAKTIGIIERTKDEDKKQELYQKFFMEDLPGFFGLNLKSLRRYKKNIEEIMNDASDPKEVLLRLFNFSEFQIKSDDERKKKPRKMKKSELKKYFPELYKEMEEKKKMPADVQEQIDKIKEEQKRIREEALEKVR